MKKSTWYTRLAGFLALLVSFCIIVVWWALSTILFIPEYIFLGRKEPFFYEWLGKINNWLVLSKWQVCKDITEMLDLHYHEYDE